MYFVIVDAAWAMHLNESAYTEREREREEARERECDVYTQKMKINISFQEARENLKLCGTWARNAALK